MPFLQYLFGLSFYEYPDTEADEEKVERPETKKVVVKKSEVKKVEQKEDDATAVAEKTKTVKNGDK